MTADASTGRRRRGRWHQVALFIASLLLFVLALELMRNGARGLTPLINNLLRINNPVNGLGFGWLFAYVVMSGSPAAAASLTFFDAGLIDQASAYAMITGSRMGAFLLILVVGFVYMLRGGERVASLVTGLLSLTITASVYLAALPLGYILMTSRWLDDLIPLKPNGPVVSVVNLALGPPVQFISGFLPSWAVFLVGLGIITASFNLFDKTLPRPNLRESAFSGVARILYRPMVTFTLGLAVTMITMSVSVSLGLLVPLSARGYIRRENLVPYIMGCNITTFVDTLVAGLLLGNPHAAVVVLAQMISVLIVSIVILVLFFGPYERGVLRLALWLSESRTRLAATLLIALVLPLVLLVVR